MHAAVIAIRSLHGQSQRVCANLEHTQPRVPLRLARDFIGLLHSTTFASIIGAIHEGLQGQGRLGSMMSIFPPWDQRTKSMQRWKAGDKYNITIVFNVMRVFQYVADKQGMHDSNTGSVTIPTVLPIQYLCDQIYLLAGEGKGLVLFSA